MENNSDRMGFALIALSVVAFVLLAVNGPLKSTVNGFFNGFKDWQTTSSSNVGYGMPNKNLVKSGNFVTSNSFLPSHDSSFTKLSDTDVLNLGSLPYGVISPYELKNNPDKNNYSYIVQRIATNSIMSKADTVSISAWILKPDSVSSSDFEKYFRVGYLVTDENGNNWKGTGGSLVPVSVIDVKGKWVYVSGSIKGYVNSDPYKILTIGYTNYPDELRGNLSLIFGGIKMEKSESGTMFTP